MRKIFKINVCALTLFLAAAGLFSFFAARLTVPASGGLAGVRLPIVMYHSVLKDTSLSGKYVITPSQLEEDIEYLLSQGYTSVSMREVIDFAENGAPLPDKPFMLTFDDGCYNNYGYVLPILEKYGVCAVFSIVGEYTDRYTEENVANMTYGYMRLSEISELAKSPYAEIANHSYGFHSDSAHRSGSKKRFGESGWEYRALFRSDTEKAQSLLTQACCYTPYIYTYPFGLYSEESFNVLKELGFKATLSCNEGINIIAVGDSLYLLNRFNRPCGISSADFFEKILLSEKSL